MIQNSFSRELLLALSNWQNGWWENQDTRRIIADELVKECASLSLDYRTANVPCYRKRFIAFGELYPILMENGFFEGIASWTADDNLARSFKGIIRPDTSFVMVFEHYPKPEEVIVNISSLWENENFENSANQFKLDEPEKSKALF